MPAERFESFGSTHLMLLALFVVGAVAAVLLGRRLRDTAPAVATSRAAAAVLAVAALASQALQLTPGRFDVHTSLPLQLCDLAWMSAVWALWSHHRVPTALTYFWGLTLTVQAVLTPSLDETFPDPLFVAFWVVHLLTVWSALYLTVGLGLGPRWREYAVTVAVTVTWAVLVFVFNDAVGVNYGYVNRKPASASLLDLLGPWPAYVLLATAILVAGWALMTWPWTRVGSRHAIRTPRRAGP